MTFHLREKKEKITSPTIFTSLSYLFSSFSKYYPDENSRGAEVRDEEKRHGSWIGTLLNNLVPKEGKKEGRKESGSGVRRLKKTQGEGAKFVVCGEACRARQEAEEQEGREGGRKRALSYPGKGIGFAGC